MLVLIWAVVTAAKPIEQPPKLPQDAEVIVIAPGDAPGAGIAIYLLICWVK